MAFTDFTPLTRVQESQDAQQIKIWDESTWNGESALTTICNVIVQWYDDDGVLQVCDPYELIPGGVDTKFLEYLSRDGHIIDITDLAIDGVAIGDRFFEGRFVIETIYSDGTYSVGSFPYYKNPQAFLAKNWCMARKLPSKLSWPLTPEVYRINRDIFMQKMYLQAAEDAVDLGKTTEFDRIMSLVRSIFNYYEIEEVF